MNVYMVRTSWISHKTKEETVEKPKGPCSPKVFLAFFDNGKWRRVTRVIIDGSPVWRAEGVLEQAEPICSILKPVHIPIFPFKPSIYG